MADIHHIHRSVVLPLKTLDDVAREHGIEIDAVEQAVLHRPDLVELLRESHPQTFRDHIREALADPKVTFFLGGYVGVFLTLLSAAIWEGVL